jgi:hypothetical protein
MKIEGILSGLLFLDFNTPNRVSDIKVLKDVFEMDSVENLRKSHTEWIRTELGGAEMGRDEIWTKSIAVGSEDFVYRTQHLEKSNQLSYVKLFDP